MSEDTPSRDPDQISVTEPTPPEPPSVDSTPDSTAAPPEQAHRGSAVRRWLPYLLVAVIPALIVGLAVYFLAGGSDDGGDQSAAVLDGFVHSNGPSDTEITSFKAQVPPGFPKEFPVFSGARPVSSFLAASDEGRHYFAVFSTSASPAKVYDYYLDVMDKDPWQVQIAASGDSFTGLRFNNPGNPDVQGEVAVYRSNLDNDTHIYVTYQDESSDAKKLDKPKTAFKLGDSYNLPQGFPSDVMLYDKGGKPVVVETYFERSPGTAEYSVSYLTRASQGDVIKAYEDDLKKKGWDVREPPSSSSRDFALGRAFTDNKQIEGTVSVDTFDKDDSYQKVDLYVSISKGGTGGGQPGARLTPTANATPRQGN